jgi:hypothetical protein
VSVNENPQRVELSGSQYLGQQRSGYMLECAVASARAGVAPLATITVVAGLFRVDKDATPESAPASPTRASPGIPHAPFFLRRGERVVFTSRNDNEELKNGKSVSRSSSDALRSRSSPSARSPRGCVLAAWWGRDKSANAEAVLTPEQAEAVRPARRRRA